LRLIAGLQEIAREKPFDVALDLPITISLAVRSNEAAVTERSFQRSPACNYLLDLLASKGKSRDAH
jgi:hypothetical protein